MAIEHEYNGLLGKQYENVNNRGYLDTYCIDTIVTPICTISKSQDH